MSAISSEALWEQSGRLGKIGSEVSRCSALRVAARSNAPPSSFASKIEKKDVTFWVLLTKKRLRHW